MTPRCPLVALLRLLAAVAFAHTSSGCDGVGRALVESTPTGDGSSLTCEAFPCRDMPMYSAPEQVVVDAEPQLERCSPSDPAACEPVSEPSLGPTPVGCRRTLSLDDETLDRDAIRELRCANARLVRMRRADAPLRLEDVVWSEAEIEIETATELELELVRAQLDRVKVRLRGPVTLRVVDSVEVSAVTLETDAERAAVDFRSSTATQLTTGESATAFAGLFSSTRSTLRRAEIEAREVRFETVALSEARIDAERLQFVDVTTRAVELRFEEGIFSASRLRHVKVERCGALGVYGTELENFRIGACDAPTRVFDSRLNQGMIDGEIAADDTRFEQTLFGLHAPTDLQLWDGDVSNSNFCAGTDRVALAGKVTGSCTDCKELDGSSVPVDACMAEGTSALLLRCCLALEFADACRPTLERMRPPFD